MTIPPGDPVPPRDIRETIVPLIGDQEPKQITAMRSQMTNDLGRLMTKDGYPHTCPCAKCVNERFKNQTATLDEKEGFLVRLYSGIGLILCPNCGNKRCPHATDHALGCTMSNEPGQAGSAYA